MSSSEPNKNALIPAGLPLSYVGSWAAVGIGSLAYLGVVMNAPDRAAPEAAPPQSLASHAADETGRDVVEVAESRKQEAQSAAEAPAKPATAETNSGTEIAAAAPSLPETTDDVQRAEENTGQADEVSEVAGVAVAVADTGSAPVTGRVSAEPVPTAVNEINTRYVSTQQILAARAAAATEEPRTVPAASNIVTGSITVPPPPQRAPPPPDVVRKVLKPALARPLPKPSRTARQTSPKVTTPIDFGPAVVTETKAAADEPPALAILLATGSSVESLRLTWNLLQERHGSALVNLSPRYIMEPNPQAPERKFALLAGPVVSATDIARVCSVLVNEGMSCHTRPFGGNSM